LTNQPSCDKMLINYRLPQRVQVSDTLVVEAEVLFRITIEQCRVGFELGDIAYTNTLFPGENVKLFTSDRFSRFTFDSESSLSYRNEQTTEEDYFFSSLYQSVTDIESKNETSSSATNNTAVSGNMDTSGAIGTVLFGADVDMSGTYDAESTNNFSQELSYFVGNEINKNVKASKILNSVSIGEVMSRQHKEGESEDSFEASSRSFSNTNKCHAVTYYFYRINKVSTVKMSIEEIQIKVKDPVATTTIIKKPPFSTGQIAVVPTNVLATSTKRIEVEETARHSIEHAAANPQRLGIQPQASIGKIVENEKTEKEKISNDDSNIDVKLKAKEILINDLTKSGLLQRGKPSEQIVKQFSFEKRVSLPTPGFYVKGCLDDCSVCEEFQEEDFELDLEYKRLLNKKLRKEIECLDCWPDKGTNGVSTSGEVINDEM
ncbi:MAG: hypothetical protein ACC656_05850, partial [Candidatus Heimdallarchaeota archaeon]